LPPLPEGWIRVKSRNNGSVYYCCKDTGETTFVEPTSAQAVNRDSDMPPGWIEMTSRSTGRKYYWNTITQKSQFEKPVLTAPNSGRTEPRFGSDNDGLPDGWVSMVSRTTGKTYYFNSKSQKSQYDRPAESSM
jgi:YHS domain-containing protein